MPGRSFQPLYTARRARFALVSLFTAACSLLTFFPAWSQTPRLAAPALDEKVLRDQQIPTDGPALLDFFRKRTPGPDLIRQFDKLLARCASDAYDERSAAAELIERMGATVRPLLVRVVHAPPADREVLQRAVTSLAALPEDRDAAPAMAAARLLAAQKPDGTLAVLLDYLPFAPNDLVRQEVQLTVNALALGEAAKHKPALLQALQDADPFKRASAGEALTCVGPAGKTLAAPLLRDPNPRVRLQIALALAEAGERDAVRVLIDLLAVLPPDVAWSAQEPLLRLADDDTSLPVIGGSLTPAQIADAWSKWWKHRPAQADIKALSSKRPESGQIVLTCSGTGVKNAKIIGLGPDKELVWQIEGLRYPVDVQILGKNRVLIAEYLGRRVTERDLKGNILWDRSVPLPIACQRLPGGLTFIACRQQLMVVDRQGRDTLAYYHTGPSIVAAQRLHDGHMVIACAGGTCHVLDPQGRELKNFRVGQLYTMGANLDVLPGGRVLVPLFAENLVAEFDFDGNQLWKATVARPTSAVRLPGGNTLVVSYLDNRVVEITPEGTEVWAYATDGRPWRARQR